MLHGLHDGLALAGLSDLLSSSGSAESWAVLEEAVLSDTALLETVHGFAGALCQWALRGEGAQSLPRWRDLYPGCSAESLNQPPWYLGYIQEVQDSLWCSQWTAVAELESCSRVAAGRPASRSLNLYALLHQQLHGSCWGSQLLFDYVLASFSTSLMGDFTPPCSLQQRRLRLLLRGKANQQQALRVVVPWVQQLKPRCSSVCTEQ